MVLEHQGVDGYMQRDLIIVEQVNLRNRNKYLAVREALIAFGNVEKQNNNCYGNRNR